MNKQEQLIFFKLLTFQPGTSFMMTTSSSKFSLSIRKVLAQRQHSAQHLNSWPVFASLGSIKDGHSSCVWKGQWPSICILSNGQQRATPVLEKKTPKAFPNSSETPVNTFLMCLGTQFVVCVCTEQTIEAILSMKVNLGVRKEKHLSLRLHNRQLQTNI